MVKEAKDPEDKLILAFMSGFRTLSYSLRQLRLCNMQLIFFLLKPMVVTVFVLLFPCLLAVIGIGMALIPFFIILSETPRYDSYSLALTAVDGFGRPAGGATSPAFNLNLYVKNTRFIWENCFSHGRVAVSYGGIAMGEVRVRGWCAGTRSTTEVETLVRGKDVHLADGLRRRMDAEVRWGVAELDVQAMLFRDHEERKAPVLLRCKTVGPQVPPQPQDCEALTDFQV
jgi:hypothetical protein